MYTYIILIIIFDICYRIFLWWNTTFVILTLISCICFLSFYHVFYEYNENPDKIWNKILNIIKNKVKFIKGKNEEYWTKQVLTEENEIDFYQTLKEELHKHFEHRFLIFPQVRMLDIFQSKSKYFYPIYWSIDFLIVDSINKMNPILWIELNWPEHKYDKKRIGQDRHKKYIFDYCWIKLITIDNKDKQNKNLINELIIKRLKDNIKQ